MSGYGIGKWEHRVACLFSHMRPRQKGVQQIEAQDLGEKGRLLRVTDKETGAELARGEGATYREALADMRRRLS